MIYRFAGYVLDTGRMRLTRGDNPVAMEPQVFDLLVLLVQQRDRVVSKDEILERIWKGRVVSDAALNSRISAVRKAVGDDGDRQETLQTVRGRGFRFIAPVEVPPDGAADRSAAPNAARHEVIRYCRTSDDIAIAYAVSGEGPRLLKAANWLSHLEYDRESPVWQHLLNFLGQGRQLVRYDRRGCGLSDHAAGDYGFEESLRDFEAVAAQFETEPFDVFSMSGGCALAIAYAARHPQHVRRMILIGGSPLGFHNRSPGERATREALVALTREGWGQDNPAFRQVFTSMMFPDATAEQARWFNDLQRRSSSPEVAARIMDSYGHYDVTGLLAQVRCPTLVMHSGEDAMVAAENGRRLAAGIPGAQFVSLPSRNHLILEHEPAWPMMRAEIEAFLSAG